MSRGRLRIEPQTVCGALMQEQLSGCITLRSAKLMNEPDAACALRGTSLKVRHLECISLSLRFITLADINDVVVGPFDSYAG